MNWGVNRPVTTPFFIEAEHLKYAYRKAGNNPVLKEVGLFIKPDEYLLVCGASGSGKSTLCRTFNALIPHFYGGSFQGEVRVAGVSTGKQSIVDLFSQVGMIFQNPEAQLFNRTVEGEIVFGLESLGLSKSEIRRRTSATVEMIGIEALMPKNPQALSGGEQQLVCIAAIMALKPQVIVLDEPYANLDPARVETVRAALGKVHQSGRGVIICEHRLPLTVADVQRIVVLHDGRIVLDDLPGKIFGQDLKQFGLELPLAVNIGRRLKLSKIPLDVKELENRFSSNDIPPDLFPAEPAPPASGACRVLEVERVSFELGDRLLLRDINFSLKQGESLALVGANGAGKTTLLKHLNGLYRPTEGLIRVIGHKTSEHKVSQLARFVGVAFQNPNSQFFKLTVWDEIIVGARVLDCYDESWIRELVSLFRLEPLLKRAPYRLSEGEKKRVAFAAALSAKPAILALDEPTAGQDMFFRLALGRLLANLRSRGQAILLVTQDLAFAEQHAHRWLMMAEGKIVADGSPREVMADTAAMKSAGLRPTDSFQLYRLMNRRKKKVRENFQPSV